MRDRQHRLRPASLAALALVAVLASPRDATAAPGRSGSTLFDTDGAAELESIRAGRAGIEIPGLAVARFTESGAIDTRAVGCARFDTDGRRCLTPLTRDSVMRIASISKLVTALATIQLVTAGKLDLDRDVSDYVGFALRNPTFPDTPITLRELLAHTSSVRDGDVYWAPHPHTLAEALAQPEHFDSGHAPGSYFTYSNLNFGIVGHIIECVAGERFDRYMERTLLEPRGVTAGYNWSGLETLPPERVTSLYRRQSADEVWNLRGPWVPQVDDFGGSRPRALVRSDTGSSAPPADYRLCSNGTLFAPHGGLRISTRDLARLVQGALRDGTLERLAAPVWRADAKRINGDTQFDLYRSFGLGLQLDLLESGLVGHFGDAYGLKGGVLVDLVARRGWVYLINGTAAEPRLAAGRFSGLDTTEAAVLTALGL
jgi:CubicO group peptidase (beta-lactamase class C family)